MHLTFRKLINKISIGDMFAVETATNLYQRVQVMEVTEEDKRGNPCQVRAQFLEGGQCDLFMV